MCILLSEYALSGRAGYRASIIDYANKIEELFTKMEGTRADVLPPNQKFFDNYFNFVWKFVHTLTAAVTPLEPELGTSDLERFKPYLEAEEIRLSTNLKAVDYDIDGTDTLTLITGVGRIEKVGARQHIQSPARLNYALCPAERLSSYLLAAEAPLRDHAGHADQGFGLA